jgi:hypothetical protein
MERAKLITGKVLCFIGLHNWKYTPERSQFSWRVNMKCQRTCDARSHTIKADKIGRKIWG